MDFGVGDCDVATLLGDTGEVLFGDAFPPMLLETCAAFGDDVEAG